MNLISNMYSKIKLCVKDISTETPLDSADMNRYFTSGAGVFSRGVTLTFSIFDVPQLLRN